jgi:hypothetical protein
VNRDFVMQIIVAGVGTWLTLYDAKCDDQPEQKRTTTLEDTKWRDDKYCGRIRLDSVGLAILYGFLRGSNRLAVRFQKCRAV